MQGGMQYGGLLQWCERTGVICWDRLLQLELEAKCYAQEAERVMGLAVSVRACLSELFGCLMDGRPVHGHVLHLFNSVAGEVKGHLRYEVGPRGLEQFWVGINEELMAPLWFVMSEAMLLVDNSQLRLVKRCPLCGSFFLDSSRSGNRRWCNPNTCGSVAKSSGYYDRKISEDLQPKTGEIG
jgi:predicted RNA-binding Zn ribbon-like protein